MGAKRPLVPFIFQRPVPARLYLAGCSLKASGFSEPEAHRSLLQATRLKEQTGKHKARMILPAGATIRKKACAPCRASIFAAEFAPNLP